MLGRLVGFQALAAADVGIDRYLNGLAASTLPTDEVDDGLATLVADELGGFGGYLKVGRHKVCQSSGCSFQGASGSKSSTGGGSGRKAKVGGGFSSRTISYRGYHA